MAYRSNLRALVSRHDKQASDSKRTDPHSHATFSHLSFIPDKCTRYHKEHELRKACQRQITNLKQRLEGATEKRGITEDSSLNNDLLHMMKENAKAFCDAHPPGTFGRISFERVRCRLLLLKINDRCDGILSWYGGVSIFATCPVQHMNYCKNQGPSCSHLREHLGTTPIIPKMQLDLQMMLTNS